jgi:hypothetical protein
MKGLPDLNFSAYRRRDGLFVGVCRELPKLRSSAHKNRLDALDAIITLVAQRLCEIDQQRAGGGA